MISSRVERRFYIAFAGALAATVFAGFAPTLYLRGAYEHPKPLNALLYAHGVAFTAWILLLLSQTLFVSVRRLDLHRRVGMWTVALAAIMVILGADTALTLAYRLEQSVGEVAAAHAALALFDLPVFAGLVTAAYFSRSKPQTHKRLMLLATVTIIGAAVNRLPFPIAPGFTWIRFALVDLFVIALIVWDFVSLRRIHFATIAGGLALVADQVAQSLLGGSQSWARIVANVVQ